MSIINHAPSLIARIASILDLSPHDKKNLASILNKNPANENVNPQAQIQNEQEKQLTILANKNEAQHNNDTLSLINQFINQPLLISIKEFDNVAHDEQNRLLRSLSEKENIIK